MPLLALAVGRVVPLLSGVVVRLFQRAECLLEIIAGAADRLVLDDVNVVKLRPFAGVLFCEFIVFHGYISFSFCSCRLSLGRFENNSYFLSMSTAIFTFGYLHNFQQT